MPLKVRELNGPAFLSARGVAVAARSRHSASLRREVESLSDIGCTAWVEDSEPGVRLYRTDPLFGLFLGRTGHTADNSEPELVWGFWCQGFFDGGAQILRWLNRVRNRAVARLR